MRYTFVLQFIQICTILQYSCAVPARTPELLLQDDLNAITASIKQLSVQMENLNFLYLNNLEPKVALTTTSLATIDTSLRNIQERAHVWDTFQLYIASWNEQMSTSDRKLDIISKGQQKLFALDAKVNSIVGLGLEYKIDSVFKKLSQIEDSLGVINKNIKQSPKDTLFAEFAAKGILSAVKTIEMKLDVNNNVTTNFDSTRAQEMLSDVSSKVDIIYDRVNTKEDAEELELDELEGSGDEFIQAKKQKVSPSYKQISQQLSDIKSALNNTERNTDAILDFQRHLSNDIKGVVEKTDVSSYFSEQRAHFDSIVKKQGCAELPKPNISVATTAEPKLPKLSCSDLYVRETGIYYSERVPIFCIKNDHIWTVIQKRQESLPYENFSLSWVHYKAGFGNVEKEFWAGNEFIHSVTTENGMVLRVELEDFVGNFAWAEYDTFVVGSEVENYVLRIGGYRGNASDALTSHDKTMFSTFDRKNDQAPACCPCAVSYGGGWWYNSCFEANLNGVYLENPRANGYFEGIIWEPWLGNYSLRRTTMMIRKKTVEDKQKNANETTVNEIPFYEDP